jgi:hypothetical protein
MCLRCILYNRCTYRTDCRTQGMVACTLIWRWKNTSSVHALYITQYMIQTSHLHAFNITIYKIRAMPNDANHPPYLPLPFPCTHISKPSILINPSSPSHPLHTHTLHPTHTNSLPPAPSRSQPASHNTHHYPQTCCPHSSSQSYTS